MNESRARILIGDLLGDPKVVFVAGKGGVGKTTISRVLAELGVLTGLRTVIVTLEQLAHEQSENLSIINLAPNRVMMEYLVSHGFGPLASRLESSGVIDAVATAIPGIKDLLVLAKIKQLSQSGDWDLVLVDSPASGHTLSMLLSPEGLGEIATEGPISDQSTEVIDLLSNHQLSGVLIVTIPEESPITEATETIDLLTHKVGVNVVSLVINQMPAAPPETAATPAKGSAEDAALSYLTRRHKLASSQVDRLKEGFEGPVFLIEGIPDRIGATAMTSAILGQLERRVNLA